MSPAEKVIADLGEVPESEIEELVRVWDNAYAILYQRRGHVSRLKGHLERLDAAREAVVRHWRRERSAREQKAA